MRKRQGRVEPLVWAMFFAGVTGAALVVPWIYAVLLLHGAAGGTIGFWGDPGEPADAWWYWPAVVAVTVLALALVYASGSRAYGIVARKREAERSGVREVW